MNDDLRHQILSEIEELSEPPKKRDDEITIREFAEHLDITYREAQGRLQSALKSGKISRRKVLDDGHWKWAYTLNKEEEENEGDLR